MGVYDYLIIIAVAACIAAVVVYMVKRRKKGGCGCNCAGCPYSGGCDKAKTPDNKEKP